MKGQRDYKEGEVLQSVEVVDYGPVNATAKQVRYNLKLTETDGHKSVEFDYVNVPELTKAEVKDAIIKSVYPAYRDELAAINNGGADYEAYQQLRSQADEVWEEIRQ